MPLNLLPKGGFGKILIQILLQSLQELGRHVCTSEMVRGFLSCCRGKCRPSLPLGMVNNIVEIVGYDYKYLTSDETRMVRLLEKFDVIESRILIKRWQ